MTTTTTPMKLMFLLGRSSKQMAKRNRDPLDFLAEPKKKRTMTSVSANTQNTWYAAIVQTMLSTCYFRFIFNSFEIERFSLFSINAFSQNNQIDSAHKQCKYEEGKQRKTISFVFSFPSFLLDFIILAVILHWTNVIWLEIDFKMLYDAYKWCTTVIQTQTADACKRCK